MREFKAVLKVAINYKDCFGSLRHIDAGTEVIVKPLKSGTEFLYADGEIQASRRHLFVVVTENEYVDICRSEFFIR